MLHRLIKEFEREARTDGMPPLDLATRKKALVQELNGYITAKKDFTVAATAKAELTGSNSLGTRPGTALKSQQGQYVDCKLRCKVFPQLSHERRCAAWFFGQDWLTCCLQCLGTWTAAAQRFLAGTCRNCPAVSARIRWLDFHHLVGLHCAVQLAII